MTTTQKAMQMALEALEGAERQMLNTPERAAVKSSIEALRAALAQEQEDTTHELTHAQWLVKYKSAQDCISDWIKQHSELNRETTIQSVKYQARIAELEAALAQEQEQEPTVERNSQDWAGMRGDVAFQLITRHADGWADVNLMMEEWLAANAAPQPAQPLTWQPIDTAPKDVVILLGLPIAGNLREGDRRVYEGRWHEAQETWTSVNGFLLFTDATHWMPLPPAPTALE